MLGLETEACALWVHVTGLSREAIQKIAGIKLHAGLRGRHLKNASACGLYDAGGGNQSLAAPVDHEVVIVAIAVTDLLMIVVDACADCRGRTEIQRGSFNGCKFARRDERGIDGRVPARMNRQLMLEHIP